MSAAIWAFIENIVLIICSFGLAYAWDTPWPLLILIFANQIKSIKEVSK